MRAAYEMGFGEEKTCERGPTAKRNGVIFVVETVLRTTTVRLKICRAVLSSERSGIGRI